MQGDARVWFAGGAGVIRNYIENDVGELLRMRCLLYPDHSREELNDEIMAFAYRPHSNPFVNYDVWTSFVCQRESGGLGGFIDVGFMYAGDYKERLPHFMDTVYFEQMQAHLSAGLSVPVVESWYVDEDLRGKRIGTQLMRQAERWVKERNCPFILSDTDDFRDVSQKAHQAFGYDNYYIAPNGCRYFYKRIV